MIVLEKDLTKYLNDPEFYDKKYLEYNKKGWKSLYDSTLKKNYKTENKKTAQIEMLKKCVEQLFLIDTLLNNLSK